MDSVVSNNNQQYQHEQRTIDPIRTFRVSSSVKSVCLIPKQQSYYYGSNRIVKENNNNNSNNDFESGNSRDNNNNDDDDDDSSSSDIQFQCSLLASQEQDDLSKNDILESNILCSCHESGESFLWNLQRQEQIQNLTQNRAGPGMHLDKMSLLSSSPMIVYQTRDYNGTVSMHDIISQDLVTQFQTKSQTFCTVAPCRNTTDNIIDYNIDYNFLIAMPSENDKMVTIQDIRTPTPVLQHLIPKHGMLTSLAMCSSSSATTTTTVACGMESGTIKIFDLQYPKSSVLDNFNSCNVPTDPILSLDMKMITTKENKNNNATGNILLLAGLAGDAAEENGLKECNQGRVVLLKYSNNNDNNNNSNSEVNLHVTHRMSTSKIHGSPGVATVQFSPSLIPLWAVGGWDHRIRLFQQQQQRFHSQNNKVVPLGILRGHTTAVTAIDWATGTTTNDKDAFENGYLLASGGGDLIHVWNCFGK